MTYSAVYCALITKRLQNPLPEDEYGEVHHIIPKSEGGTNDKDNLVRLSAREHYIAHLLLAKIYNDWKMTSAVMYFSSNNTCHGGGRRIMTRNRLFAKMRECFARKQREKLGGKSFFVGKGEQNPMFGKDWRVGKSYEELDKIKNRMSKLMSGSGNPMFGKSSWDGLTDAERSIRSTKFSNSMKGRNKGKRFWNNGVVVRFSIECPGHGFVEGVLPETKLKHSKAMRGRKFSEEHKRKIGESRKRYYQRKRDMKDGEKKNL